MRQPVDDAAPGAPCRVRAADREEIPGRNAQDFGHGENMAQPDLQLPVQQLLQLPVADPQSPLEIARRHPQHAHALAQHMPEFRQIFLGGHRAQSLLQAPRATGQTAMPVAVSLSRPPGTAGVPAGNSTPPATIASPAGGDTEGAVPS